MKLIICKHQGHYNKIECILIHIENSHKLIITNSVESTPDYYLLRRKTGARAQGH